MTSESRVVLRRGPAVLAAVALVLGGAGAAYLLMRSSAASDGGMANMPSGADARSTAGAPASVPATAPPSADANSTPLPDIVVPLSAEAAERAGIIVTPVSTGSSTLDLRLPGVVAPNAYRQLAVTPLVGGRVTRVSVELGDRVRRGQTIAQIYSPELAEAQTRYVSARAMLDAHDRELKRTQKLVEIGAASRQELERIHAEHAAQTAAVQSARSQLELLGVSPAALDKGASAQKPSATTSVPAPIDGIVTERAANAGLNVDPATKLLTIVDLSTVWVIADLYEKDFSRVRVGSDAAITTAAMPGAALRGRVSYIDPQVSPETRTARVRVEVPNPRGELRLGMYADVVITGASGGTVPLIPRGAVQNVGDRTVVYLVNPNERGKFVEREVRLGQTSGEQVEVASGVQPGDVLVTGGSFFVRAERERLGLRLSQGMPSGTSRGPLTTRGGSPNQSVQTAKVLVNEQGFEPPKLSLRTGTPARITFLRTTDKTCATEVVFPSLSIKRALPLNEPVIIEFTPPKTGEVAFACGMNMFRGVVIVEQK